MHGPEVPNLQRSFLHIVSNATVLVGVEVAVVIPVLVAVEAPVDVALEVAVLVAVDVCVVTSHFSNS